MSTQYLKSSHQIHRVRFLVEIQVMPKGKILKRQCNHQNQTQMTEYVFIIRPRM